MIKAMLYEMDILSFNAANYTAFKLTVSYTNLYL
jgi:hypothetical protein